MTELQLFMHPYAHFESTWLRVQFYYSFLVSLYLGVFVWIIIFVNTVILVVNSSRRPFSGDSVIVNDEERFQVIILRYGLVLLK